MDQATSSSWKLLPWPILGGFNKKARADKSLKKVSAFKRRLQAHAAITRSLSPFCARTSFDSAAVREEENKCLLSLSAFIHACGRCTSSSLRDVDDIVPLGPLHSPHQHKAYINAIHHHLFTDHQPTHHETYLHMEILSPRIAQNKAFVEPSHIDKSVSLSREANPSQHHHRHMTPSRRAHIKKIGVIQCHENEIKANKQEKNHQQDHRQGITKAKGELKPVSRHGKCHCGPKGPSFDSGDDNWIEHAHNDGKPSTSSLKKCHHRPNDPSLATSSKSNWYVHAHNRKPNTSSLISSGTKPLAELETHHKRDSSANGKTKTKISQLEADLHICTPTHVLKQHRGKMKAFEEDMHQYKDQDPPILKNTHHHKHASKDPSRKRVHRLARKSKDTHWHAIEEPQSLKESHYHPSDVSSLTESTHHPHTSKNPSPMYLSLKENDAYSVPLSLKGRESNANKELSLKVTPLHACKDPQLLDVNAKGGVSDTTRARQEHEKIKLKKSDHHKVNGGIWMPDTLLVVKYSHDPYVDFHNSMLEMLLGRGLKDLHELQDMFVCYVLLNSPCNQKHIEKAFRDLLTDLYKCKLEKSLQVEEMQHAKPC